MNHLVTAEGDVMAPKESPSPKIVYYAANGDLKIVYSVNGVIQTIAFEDALALYREYLAREVQEIESLLSKVYDLMHDETRACRGIAHSDIPNHKLWQEDNK